MTTAFLCQVIIMSFILYFYRAFRLSAALVFDHMWLNKHNLVKNKAGYTATSCGRVGRGGNARFHSFELDHYRRTDQRTDRRTDGRTDGQSLL